MFVFDFQLLFAVSVLLLVSDIIQINMRIMSMDTFKVGTQFQGWGTDSVDRLLLDI